MKNLNIKPIEAKCNNESGVNNTYLKVNVSYIHYSTNTKFTHFRIQDQNLIDIINFTLSDDQSKSLEDFLSNKDVNIKPLILIDTLQKKIVVNKENETTYNLHINSILFNGSVFSSSYSFTTPFL